MKLAIVLILLLFLLAGCHVIQGLVSGASDELDDIADRPNMPGIGAKTESKVAYVLGGAGALALAVFLGRKKKK